MFAGVDVNGRDYDGRTALHVASAFGHIDIVKRLMKEKGIQVCLLFSHSRISSVDATVLLNVSI